MNSRLKGIVGWFGLVMGMLVLRAAWAQTPLPRSPWDLPAEESCGTLLLFPAETPDGFWHPKDELLVWAISRYIEMYGPTSLTVCEWDVVLGWLKARDPLAGDGEVAVDAAGVEMCVRYTAATHVARFKYDKRDARTWILSAELMTPRGSISSTFEIQNREDLELARQVASWIVQNGGWEVPPGYMPLFGQPLIDHKHLSTDFLKMDWDMRAEDPAALLGQLKGLRQLNPGSLSLLVLEQEECVRRGKQTRSLMEGVGDRDLYVEDHYYLHYGSFQHLRQKSDMKFMSARQLECFAAKRPGINLAGNLLTHFHPLDPGAPVLRAAELWHGRIPPSPCADSWLGDVWWGFASSDEEVAEGVFYEERLVGPRECAERAIKLKESAMHKGGENPGVMTSLISLYGLVGDREKMWDMHERTVAAFPDIRRAWENVIHHSSPQWGGAPGEAEALIDEAMASRPDNGDFGWLAWEYHRNQANYEIKDSTSCGDCMEKYFSTHPESARQIAEGIARIRDKNGRAEGFASFAVCMVFMDRMDELRSALKECPELIDELSSDFPDSRRKIMKQVLKGLYLNEQWAELGRLAAMIKVMDGNSARYGDIRRADVPIRVFYETFDANGWENISEAMLGDADGAYVQMVVPCGHLLPDTWAKVALAAAVDEKVGRRLKSNNALERVAGCLAEHPEFSRQRDLILVMDAYTKGRTEEAVQLLEEIPKPGPEEFDPLEVRVRQLVSGTGS